MSDRCPWLAIIGTRPHDPSRGDSVSLADWHRIAEDCERWLYHRWNDGGRFGIVTGGAYGIDTIAEDFAKRYRLSRIVHTPDYEDPGLTNKRAAPTIRNGLIVSAADEVHAWTKRTRGGTDDAIAKARRLGKPVIVHEAWR